MSDEIVLDTIPQFGDPTDTDLVVPVEGEKKLVSLSEVYEEAGLECYDKIINTVIVYNRSKKLDKAGCKLLGVSGVESMIPGYDRYNTIIGKEGFLSSLTDGFVNIVKSIIKYIFMAVDWVVHRIKVITGFARSEKEQEIINSMSDRIDKNVRNIARAVAFDLGIKHIVDDAQLSQIVVGGQTTLQSINMLMGADKEDVLKAVQRLETNIQSLEAIDESFKSLINNNKRGIEDYRRAMRDLRNKCRNANGTTLTEYDLELFVQSIRETIVKNFDASKPYAQLKDALERIFEIDLPIASTQGIISKQATDALEALKPVAVRINPNEAAEVARSGTKIMAKAAALFNKDKLAYDIHDLRDLVNQDDATFIRELSQKFPDFELLPAYLEFSSRIKDYASLLDMMSKVITGLVTNLRSLVDFSNKLTVVVDDYILYICNWISEYVVAAAKENSELPKPLTPEQLVERLSKTFKKDVVVKLIGPGLNENNEWVERVYVDIESAIVAYADDLTFGTKIVASMVNTQLKTKETDKLISNFFRSCGIKKRW